MNSRITRARYRRIKGIAAHYDQSQDAHITSHTNSISKRVRVFILEKFKSSKNINAIGQLNIIWLGGAHPHTSLNL